MAAAASPMQGKAIGLLGFMAVLLTVAGTGLRLVARDEGRQAIDVTVIGRILLTIVLTRL